MNQVRLGRSRRPLRLSRRRRRRPVIIAVVVAVLVVAAGAAGGSYLLLRHAAVPPNPTASAYLRDWQQGSYAAMDRISVNVPAPGGLATPIREADAQLGVRSLKLRLGRVTTSGSTARATFTAADTLVSGHTWSYRGLLHLVRRTGHWRVSWSPAAIYPGLGPGQRFVLSAAWPARAQILASDGTVLSSPATLARSGSLELLTGTVVRATAAQAKKLGKPYKAGDQIGAGGIEQAYQAELAGRQSLTIRVEGPGKRVDATAARFPAVAGAPVRTSIVMRDQLAVSRAVTSANTSNPVDVVVLQPSTGRILAVVERPGGFDRVLEGIFPPGSTFKVVTASALALKGMTPSSTVSCPSQATIGGRTFHNDNNEQLGSTDLLHAFAISCNTTFALLASQRLDGASLGSMAATFGYNSAAGLGIPATLGHFTVPHTPVDLAADAFGQGTDLVNPLSQAAEVGAIESGTWRPPVLVTSPAPRQQAQPRPLPATILDTLRPMMRAVVTIGTAAGVSFPPGVYGKTGTAEYGSGPNPPSHGWFIGYRGDLAFAVLVEGGGFGASSAGPIAASLLRKI